MTSVLQLLLVLICTGILAGCGPSSKEEQEYLYLTTETPDSVYWDVRAEFKATTDMFFCKNFVSMGSDRNEQKSNSVFYQSKGMDTVKIPLFWDKNSLCKWKVSVVYVQAEGRCMGMSSFMLIDESYPGLEKDTPDLQDSLNISCTLNNSRTCLQCNGEEGPLLYSHRIRKTSQIKRLHIRVVER